MAHNGSVYRYRRSFSASTLEPGVAGSETEWTWLSNSGARTQGGGVWGVGAMGNWTQLGNEVEQNHYRVDTNWVLVSRGTEVSRVGDEIRITRFEPIRFQPGEVKFFGAHATEVVDGNDPANTYNGQRYFLLGEGSFFPNAGLGFTELRSSATKRRMGTGIDSGPQLLEGVDGELTIHGDSRVRVSLGSWGMGGEAASIRAGTSLRQFFGSTFYNWGRHTGNDGNRLKVDLGLRRPGGVVDRNVFIFNQFPNSTFTEVQVVDKSFEIRFRYQGANDQWDGTLPPLLDRAMVYPATPLSLLSLDSVGQFEQYLKSDEDASQWPFRVLAAGNPRYSTYNHNLLLRDTDIKVGYFGAHGFLQLKPTSPWP